MKSIRDLSSEWNCNPEWLDIQLCQISQSYHVLNGTKVMRKRDRERQYDRVRGLAKNVRENTLALFKEIPQLSFEEFLRDEGNDILMDLSAVLDEFYWHSADLLQEFIDRVEAQRHKIPAGVGQDIHGWKEELLAKQLALLFEQIHGKKPTVYYSQHAGFTPTSRTHPLRPIMCQEVCHVKTQGILAGV